MNHLRAAFIESCIIDLKKKKISNVSRSTVQKYFQIIHCGDITNEEYVWLGISPKRTAKRDTESEIFILFSVFMYFVHENKNISMEETHLKVAEMIKFNSFIKF